jgi:hypothetical protein
MMQQYKAIIGCQFELTASIPGDDVAGELRGQLVRMFNLLSMMSEHHGLQVKLIPGSEKLVNLPEPVSKPKRPQTAMDYIAKMRNEGRL